MTAAIVHHQNETIPILYLPPHAHPIMHFVISILLDPSENQYYHPVIAEQMKYTAMDSRAWPDHQKQHDF